MARNIYGMSLILGNKKTPCINISKSKELGCLLKTLIHQYNIYHIVDYISLQDLFELNNKF